MFPYVILAQKKELSLYIDNIIVCQYKSKFEALYHLIKLWFLSTEENSQYKTQYLFIKLLFEIFIYMYKIIIVIFSIILQNFWLAFYPNFYTFPHNSTHLFFTSQTSVPDKLISTVVSFRDKLWMTLTCVGRADEADDRVTLELIVVTFVSAWVVQEENAIIVL